MPPSCAGTVGSLRRLKASTDDVLSPMSDTLLLRHTKGPTIKVAPAVLAARAAQQPQTAAAIIPGLAADLAARATSVRDAAFA